MKFQDPIMHGSQYVRGIKIVRNRRQYVLSTFSKLVAYQVMRKLSRFEIKAANSATETINEPVHEISNNVAFASNKGSDQPAHTRSLIRAFASRLNIL